MIKELRKAKGLTQRALADKVGIPLRTVQKYEGGECAIENMTLGMAARLATALECTIEDLMEEKHG